MDDRNKLIEKLGELSAKVYMFGRMYHIDEVTDLTKDINELIAKVFDYSPWHTGTPPEEGDYLVAVKYEPVIGVEYQVNRYLLEPYNSFIYKLAGEGGRIIAWIPIEPYKED